MISGACLLHKLQTSLSAGGMFACKETVNCKMCVQGYRLVCAMFVNDVPRDCAGVTAVVELVLCYEDNGTVYVFCIVV
jgi:hypothetical protein